MEIFTTKVKTNLDGVLQTTQMINGIMMTGDNAANEILVELYRGVERINIPKDTKIVGYFIRSDGYTIEEEGSITDDNEIKVVIPEAAYQISGSLSIGIRMFSDQETKTVTTRRYAVNTVTKSYSVIEERSQYYKITSERRYYDPTIDFWVPLEDGENPPEDYEVEVTQTGEWVDLGANETAPDEAEVRTIKNHVTYILEDGIDPPDGVNVQTTIATDWITLGENDEAPEGADVVTSSKNIVTWGTKVVVAALTCYIQITETDAILDVYHHIPDVQELLVYIEALDTRRGEIEAAEILRVQAENDRVANEQIRQDHEEARMAANAELEAAEALRQANETARKSAETTRQSNENSRKANESQRQSAELVRQSNEDDRIEAEEQRQLAELTKQETEDNRIAAEAQRQAAETTRQTNETARETTEAQRQRNENARVTAENERVIAENERNANDSARDQATIGAINKINHMTVAATKLAPYSDPTVVISDVDGHKHISFGIVPGDPFIIQKTFTSIAAMNSYTGTDIRIGQFVMITSNVEDPDNAKMYVKTESGFSFVTDLSGATGIKGDKGDKGDTGKGITSASISSSTNKLTISYSDGSSYTSESLKGDTGKGITNAAVNSSTNKLTIDYSDGTSYTSNSLKGDKGDTGNGILSVELTDDNKLKINFTDGTNYITSIPIKGEKGDPGPNHIDFLYDSGASSLTIDFT